MNKIGKQIYLGLMSAARAHAQWDYQTSMNILHSKKKLILLGIMILPCILFSVAMATDLPSVLGGHSAYAPSFYTTGIFLASIVIGLIAGLITGVIGAGGGFIITPALMSAGIKGILAVGTDLFHIFAKAIMGTTVHRKLGNVSVGLAIAFVVGSFIGVSCGGVLNRAIYEFNPILSDLFISLIYVFLLGYLGIYAMFDFLRHHKTTAPSGTPASTAAGTGSTSSEKAKKSLSERLQASKIPPRINFDQDLVSGGRHIPAIFVSSCGFFVGLVAAIMGVGGGFLTFPMFVYILGVSSFTTVGTDILQIIFTAGYASIGQYAIYGFIFYTLAMGMLLGSLLGIQLGALTTKAVKGIYIRGFYATAILAGFANRLFALPEKLREMKVMGISPSLGSVLEQVGIWIFFVIIGFFALWLVFMFLKNLKVLREA